MPLNDLLIGHCARSKPPLAWGPLRCISLARSRLFFFFFLGDKGNDAVLAIATQDTQKGGGAGQGIVFHAEIVQIDAGYDSLIRDRDLPHTVQRNVGQVGKCL